MLAAFYVVPLKELQNYRDSSIIEGENISNVGEENETRSCRLAQRWQKYAV